MHSLQPPLLDFNEFFALDEEERTVATRFAHDVIARQNITAAHPHTNGLTRVMSSSR